jgi:hypothetical protein
LDDINAIQPGMVSESTVMWRSRIEFVAYRLSMAKAA